MNTNRVRSLGTHSHMRFWRGFWISGGVAALSLLLLITWFVAIAAASNGPTTASPNPAARAAREDRLTADHDSHLLTKADPQRLSPHKGETSPVKPVASSDGGYEVSNHPNPPSSVSATTPYTYYDYGVTKYANPPTFTIGTNNEYVINVSGVITSVGSPSPAIYDKLPTGMKWTSITANNWSCGSVTTEVNCSYALTVPVGSVNFPPIRVKVDVPVDIEPVATNKVEINPGLLPDNNPLNDVAIIYTNIDSADLVIKKTVYPEAVDVGNTITYTVVITNYGPATATVTKVNDVLSTEGITYTNVITTQGSVITTSKTAHVWNVGTLAKDKTAALTVTAKVGDKANGKQVTNTAKVSSSNASDWDPSNNTATASFVVGGVSITKSVAPSSAYAGESVTFTIKVTNTGSINATNVRVQDVISTSLDVLSTSPPGCKAQTINCSLGTLSKDSSNSLVVRARVNSTVTDYRTITDTAKVSWTPSGSTTTLSRTSSQVSVYAAPGGYLQVGKSDGLSSVARGQTISYTIAITNVGSLAVDTLRVTDTFGTNLDFVSIDPGSLSMTDMSTSANPRVWRIDSPSSLSPGNKISFSIKARVKESAATNSEVNNTVNVSANSYGRTLARSAVDSDTVSGGLEIYKSVIPSSGTVYVGQPISFTILVKNTGSLAANSVSVQDVFGSSLDILPPLPQGSSYTASTRTFSYYQSSLASGGEKSLVINARANSTVAENKTIYNSATVTWGSPSQSRTSNQVSVDVTPAGALQAGKSDGSSYVEPGDTITYTLTITNIGSLPVSSVSIADSLSDNLKLVSVIIPSNLKLAGGCSSSQYCSWLVESIDNQSALPAGKKIVFYVKAKASSGAPVGSTVTNTISASGTDTYNHYTSSSASDVNIISSLPIAPSMRIKLTVSPLQAKIGEYFTFKINIQNTGDIQAAQVVAYIQFPTLLDITSASTTKGTATTDSSNRSVKASVSTLDPDDSFILTVVTLVNTTAVPNKSHPQYAVLYWYKENELYSNTVRYRVLPYSTLPGTGMAPVCSGLLASLARTPGFEKMFSLTRVGGEKSRTLLPIILLIICLFLGFIGLVVLAYSLWARIRRPLWAGRYARLGLILMLGGALFGLASLGLPRTASPAPTQQLAELVGTKPLISTREPTQVPPTTTTTATATTTIWLPPTITPTPLTLPDYPIPTPSALPSSGPDGGVPDSSEVNRIKIPSMGLDTVVKFVPFNGDTWLIGGLKQEVAWMGDTSWPGLGGNTGLAGHIDLADGSKGPFWNLKDLKPGDEVTLFTQEKAYVYKVREQVVVEDYDMTVLEPNEKDQITLITCSDWDAELRTYLKRLVVFAELSEVKDLQGS